MFELVVYISVSVVSSYRWFCWFGGLLLVWISISVVYVGMMVRVFVSIFRICEGVDG